ncbi:MAG TPA: hypothetical protein VMW50_03410 [Dehalococcoidia bacterium]|nr:hypothetical protein [Dehalococcoidia bacterium]
MTPEEKKEFLKEFLDFIMGVEDTVLCIESNDPESDQQYSETTKDEVELIDSFLSAREGC